MLNKRGTSLDQAAKTRERKKEQNRVAQRNYRIKQRKKLRELEASAARWNELATLVTTGSEPGTNAAEPAAPSVSCFPPPSPASVTALAHSSVYDDLVPPGDSNMSLDDPPGPSSAAGPAKSPPPNEPPDDVFPVAVPLGTLDDPLPVVTPLVDPDDALQAVIPTDSQASIECAPSWTPLQLAIRNGNESMVKLLLARGASLSRRDSRGATTLHLAVEAGHESLVRLALHHSVDPNVTDCLGRTALFPAVQSENDAIAKLLLEETTVDVNHKDIWDKAALHMAVELDSEELVLLLIKYGAHVDV